MIHSAGHPLPRWLQALAGLFGGSREKDQELGLSATHYEIPLSLANLPAGARNTSGAFSLIRALAGEEARVPIFATDSEQQYSGLRSSPDPTVAASTSRVLLGLRYDEPSVVLLRGPRDDDYNYWLTRIGLGSQNVISLSDLAGDNPLSPAIARNVEIVRARLQKERGDSTNPMVLVPFYCGSEEHQAAEALGVPICGSSAKVTERFYDKISFKEFCALIGVPVIPGVSITPRSLAFEDARNSDPNGMHSPLELAAFAAAHRLTYSPGESSSILPPDPEAHDPFVFVRAAVGAGGTTAFKVSNENVMRVFDHLQAGKHEHLLVEQCVTDIIDSPNCQWFIDEAGNCHHIGTSSQILSGTAHIGNRFDPSMQEEYRDVFRLSSHIVGNMALQGYRGFLGIDYIITTEGGERRIYPVENNARMNGSTPTYGAIAALRELYQIEIPAWIQVRCEGERVTFNELLERLDGLVFDGSQRFAILPIRAETLPRGKGGFVIAGDSREHVEELLAEVLQRTGMSLLEKQRA